MPHGTAALSLVPIGRKSALRQLLTEYITEFAAMEGKELARDASGHVPYRYVDQYWLEAKRFPFGIWYDDELVGFCLLRDTGEQWQIAEFYVVPGHRRTGVGSAAVSALKRFCRSQGRYGALAAPTLRFNTRALAFWRSQGFVTVRETSEWLINVCQLHT